METSKTLTKKIIMALGISVLINMLLLGIFIGQSIRHFPPHFPPPPHHGENEMFLSREEMQKNDELLRLAEKQIESSLLKEPYNEQAVLGSLDNFNAQMQSLIHIMNKRLAERAAKLPPQERLRFLPRKPPMEEY
jgi:hypothetical protein